MFYKDSNNEWKKIDDIDETEFIFDKVENGKTYIFTVGCVSEDGKELLSSYNIDGVTITYFK